MLYERYKCTVLTPCIMLTVSSQYGEDLRKSSYTKCSAKGQSSPRSSKTGTLE